MVFFPRGFFFYSETGGAASEPDNGSDMYRARQVRPRGQGKVQTGQGHLLQRAQLLGEERVRALRAVVRGARAVSPPQRPSPLVLLTP